MKFIQHIPDVNTRLQLAKRGIIPVEFSFNCLRDFLRHEHIRYHTQGSQFKRFTICRDKEYELIVELTDGRTYKIGVLDGNIREIPEWGRDGSVKVRKDSSEEVLHS